ncbi:MAG: TetR/AcrR family transcriptional regulator [Coriobacteriia bacterium]|nr:TetR/AcrR family transcriptional regulator [Coriobacteriia bacterium]
MSVSGEIATKQRILESAAELFAKKGFTETTTRELAQSVGINAASLYYHFPSKNHILEFMLEEYSAFNTDVFEQRDISSILKNNPTAEGVLECLQLSFPSDRAAYFMNVLCVLLQEQLRNSIVNAFMSNQVILRSERNSTRIINELVNLGVLRQDTDTDYWMKLTSSIFYAFATRSMLGIGDNAPGFVGRTMADMLKDTYDLLFVICGVGEN